MPPARCCHHVAVRLLPALAAEIHDVRADHQVLHHKIRVALEARALRRGCDCDGPLLVDRKLRSLAALLPRLAPSRRWRPDFEAFDPRGADRHNRSPAAGLALQGLHEFCGAGPGDPLARSEFPPRALAEAGRRHDDSTSAGRHRGHFGPELRRFVLAQYHQGQVTVPRLLAQLRAFGIVISKRQLVRLLIAGQDGFLADSSTERVPGTVNHLSQDNKRSTFSGSADPFLANRRMPSTHR